MRQPARMRSARPPRAESQARPGSPRDRLAVLLAIVTVICLGSAFVLANGTHFLMPGALTSAHGSIENCGACHTKSGNGKLSWFHGLVAGDPLADSKACLSCHKMPNTALNPHGASTEALSQSTKRLTKVAAATPAPQSALAQSIAFPTDGVVAGGLYCATCHQEHKGGSFNLSKISNEQCRSCHVVKFDSFDGDHPKFDDYPFKRRTRIVYDHASHFGKHFPEVSKKGQAGRVPGTCTTCHSSREDKRVMAVVPFDQTCSNCHIDQITGKERVSGPKGVAFLTLPGLDLQTLKEKNAVIGEWPDASEAELTPFMKVMISRTERGRALIKSLDKVNLQDLSKASDEQVRAAANLAWEIKGLFYTMISGKASDVLADLNIGGGAKLSPNLVADLTASLPRDVLISAHQQWLPNLGTEMANRPDTSAAEQSGWSSTITESRLAGSVSVEGLFGSDGPQTVARPGPRFAQQTQSKNTPGTVATKATTAEGAVAKSSTAPPKTGGGGESFAPNAVQPEAAAPRANPGSAKLDNSDVTLTASEQPQERPADQTDDLLYPDGGAPEPASGGGDAPVQATEQAPPPPSEPAASPANARPERSRETVSATAPPQGNPTNQEDDLLFPDGGAPEAAASGGALSVEVGAADAAPTGGADAPAPGGSDAPAAEPQPRAGPVITIKTDIDPESWAEYGGWYGQDYAIFYRPTGHKDKFIYSWLVLTGLQAPKGDRGPAAAVFDSLTNKEAQGSCTKCHSVDEIPGKGKGRLVNFSPPKGETKQGRFTSFTHEPHLGIMENRGCLTCHNLEKGRPYQKSYEQGNPRSFVSNFGAAKKDLCQTCHTSDMARQDCLLCHKYHVNGVLTPTMNTKIPTQ